MDSLVTAPERLLEHAHWVAAPESDVPAAGTRPAYEFRRPFSVQQPVTSAELVVTCHGIYEAFINGVRVGDFELTPGLSSYRTTLYVQRYDVTHLLTVGENELRLVVSDGWFRGRCGASRIPDNFGTATAVIAKLRFETAEGTHSVMTDESWQVGAGPIVAADLMDGQYVDFRRIDTIDWAPVQISGDPLTRETGRLAFSPAPPVRRVQEIPAVSVVRLPSGRQIADFGEMVNGWVRLSDVGPAGTVTTLKHGEWLRHDGDLDVDHVAYPRWPSSEVLTTGQLDSVVSRGESTDVFEPRHTTHGFRYVAVDGRSDDISPASLTAVLVRSDLETTAEFTTDDPFLNQLHEVAVRSWRVNTCDVPTDCPQRERWGYTGFAALLIDDQPAATSHGRALPQAT